MGLWKSLAGSVHTRIISASIKDVLNEINRCGITLYDIIHVDELTAEVTVRQYHYKHLKGLVDRKGGTLELIKRSGLYWTIISMRRRPILLLGLMLYIFLAVFLPTRVFFVSVVGNEMVSSEIIITEAENVGIHFGASRSKVRSEQIKNALLASVPELQWAGVNTYGCVAVISVRERNAIPAPGVNCGISSIVARCDGVIQQITVSQGNVLCKVGQAVKAGQMLVSGYTDCGISIKATSAKAEIYAQTIHDLKVLTPTMRDYRGTITKQQTNYDLIIGKKLINLSKDSGISDAGCVKMYEKHYLALPGGFQLPVGIGVGTWFQYTTETEEMTEKRLASLISAQAEQYLVDSMLAGEILSAQMYTQYANGVYFLEGEYGCVEMIGQIYNEEIIEEDEQRN